MNSPRRVRLAAETPWLVAYAMFSLLIWLSCGSVMPLGESSQQHDTIASGDTPWPAFGSERIPARPLQWLSMWWLQHLL